jgi:hypothetical protein
MPLAKDASGQYVADSYGSLSPAADTAAVRVLPPRRDGKRTTCAGFSAQPAGTAHTLTILVALDKGLVVTDAASGATTLSIDRILQDQTGGSAGTIAVGDYLVVEYEDGTFAAIAVTGSGATKTPTFSATTQKIKAGTTVWFFGAPADHTDRRFICTLNARLTCSVADLGSIGTSLHDNEPVVVHYDNVTAQGVLTWVAFDYLEVD